MNRLALALGSVQILVAAASVAVASAPLSVLRVSDAVVEGVVPIALLVLLVLGLAASIRRRGAVHPLLIAGTALCGSVLAAGTALDVLGALAEHAVADF